MNVYSNDCENSINPLVSIIVPVYKVEKYLRRCIDSIVAQTYRNIEVFLVDDGSPDSCGLICDEYANKYSFIKVLHQNNQGQAAARNHGTEIASGDYITFIDSDDFVEDDYVEYLVGIQQKYDAEIAICGFQYLYENQEITERKSTLQEICMNTVEALNRMNYTKGYGSVAWAKLYRKQLIRNHPFPEGQIYEDLAILYKIVADAKTIAYGNKVGYYWLQREGSTMRSTFDERQMLALDATKAQIEYMSNKYPDVISSAKARHEAKIVELMAIAFKSANSRDIYHRLINESSYFLDVMKDKNVKLTHKIRIGCLKMGYFPGKIVFAVHEKAKHFFIVGKPQWRFIQRKMMYGYKYDI